MELRKLIQHGNSSLTISLPQQWLKDHGLKKGDVLYVEQENQQITVRTTEPLKTERITLDISGLDRTSILLYLQNVYRFGYSEIEVLFSQPTAVHYRTKSEASVSSTIHLAVNRMVGTEIIEQSQDRILIRQLTREAEEDFQVVLRRVIILMAETAKALEGSTTTAQFSAIEEMHDNVTKFVSYGMRLLNKYGHSDARKTSLYFHILGSIDKIMDVFKYTARELNGQKIGKEASSIIAGTLKSVQLYKDLFYSFDRSIMNELNKNRDLIKNRIRQMKIITPLETLCLTRLQQIQEIILDITGCRAALEY